jgi:hypothetical protein
MLKTFLFVANLVLPAARRIVLLLAATDDLTL